MKRRTFLSRSLLLGASTAGLTATAGCLSGVGSGIVSQSVEHVEPKRIREKRRTIVAFDDDAREIQILGFMFYGSSSCNRVGIESTAYDAEADTLTVTLTSKDRNPLQIACTADMAATWYRVTVRFDASLPETVAVVESRGDDHETRTVNRAEQEALCTADHPPDSKPAAKAHWTCPEHYVAVASSNASSES